jgi:hypothetical protein
MTFNAPEEAQESRKAVAGLMGLAMAEGIGALTSEHHDLTPGVSGKAPTMRSKTGGSVPAPDVVLLDHERQLYIGVEVEARSEMHWYPGSTSVEFAKLASGVEVDLTANHYARAKKGEDYDCPATWGHKNIESIMRDCKLGKMRMVKCKDGTVIIIVQGTYLDGLDTLFDQFQRGR